MDCAVGAQSRANQLGLQKGPQNLRFRSNNRQAFAFRRNTKRDYPPGFACLSNSLEETCIMQNPWYVAHTSALRPDTKGTEGSNLTLSATQSALQRKASGLLACKRCNIRNRSGRLPDHGHGNFRLFATLNSLDSNSSDILRQTPIFKTGQVGPNNRRYRPTSSVTSVISSF